MAAIRCWRCGEEQPLSFVCAACGAIQGLSADADYFAALGLPKHPDVDEAALSERYYELSRKLHPDRHQTAAPRELAESVRATALLNQAFQTLRDLESRGRYWLGRLGDELARDNSRVPSELAALVFEVQESLSEAAAAPAAERPARRSEVAAAARRVAARREQGRRELGDLLREWPAGRADAPLDGDRDEARRRARLKELLSELSYLRTLDRDVRAALEG